MVNQWWWARSETVGRVQLKLSTENDHQFLELLFTFP